MPEMLIYNLRPFVDSLKTQGGLNWTAFLFSGPVPLDQSSIPFDDQSLDALFSNCVAFDNLIFDTVFTQGQDVASFKSGLIGSSVGNYYLNVIDSKWTLTYDTFEEEVITSIEFHPAKTGFGNVYSRFKTSIGSSFEYKFKESLLIDEVDLGIPRTANRPTDIGIEARIDNAWVEIISLKSVPVGISTIPLGITTDALRLVHKTGSASLFDISLLRFKALEKPSTDNTILETTWAILRPDSPTLDYARSGNSDTPFFFMSSGGPDKSTVDMFTNKVNPRPGESLSVMGFNLRNNILEAV
jgi:hypothetical protein